MLTAKDIFVKLTQLDKHQTLECYNSDTKVFSIEYKDTSRYKYKMRVYTDSNKPTIIRQPSAIACAEYYKQHNLVAHTDCVTG